MYSCHVSREGRVERRVVPAISPSQSGYILYTAIALNVNKGRVRGVEGGEKGRWEVHTRLDDSAGDLATLRVITRCPDVLPATTIIQSTQPILNNVIRSTSSCWCSSSCSSSKERSYHKGVSIYLQLSRAYTDFEPNPLKPPIHQAQLATKTGANGGMLDM